MEFLVSIGAEIVQFFTAHWFTIAVASLVSICLYRRGTRNARRLQAAFGDLPGPKPWPFIGNLPESIKFAGKRHLQFDNYCKKYGKLFTKFSIRNVSLVVADPEMIKQILVKEFDAFHDRTVSDVCLELMIVILIDEVLKTGW